MERKPILRLICLALLTWLCGLPSGFGADSLQWTVSFEGEPNRPVVLSDGRVIVGLKFLTRPRPGPLADTVICLSATGEKLWAFGTEFGISVGPTIGSDDVIYFVSPLRVENKVSERLVALNPDSSLRWSQPLSSTPTGDLSVGADGSIILQANGLYSYFDTGLLMWSTTKIRTFNRHATFTHEGRLLFGTPISFFSLPSDGLIDPATTNAIIRGAWGPAAIDKEGKAWALNDQGQLAAFTSEADLLHSTPVPQGVPPVTGRVEPSTTSTFCPIIGEDGVVYAVTGRDSSRSRLAALESDGRLKWAITLSNQVVSPPAVARGGKLFVGRDSELLELDGDGNPVRSLDIGHLLRKPPVLTRNGQVLLAGTNQVTSLQPGFTFPAESPWPMDRGNPAGSASRSSPPGIPERPVITSIQPLIGVNRLIWTSPARPAIYEVFRAEGALQKEISLGSVSSALRQFNDTNVVRGKTYSYRIRGSNRGGVSAFSSPVDSLTVSERALWSRSASHIYEAQPGIHGEIYLVEVRPDSLYLVCLSSQGEVLWDKPGTYEGLSLAPNGNLYARFEGLLVELNRNGEIVRSIELSLLAWYPLVQGPGGNLWLNDKLGNILNLRPDFTTNWIASLPEPRPVGPLSVSSSGIGFFDTGPGELSAVSPVGGLTVAWSDAPFESTVRIPVGLQDQLMLPVSTNAGYTLISYDSSTLKAALQHSISPAGVPNGVVLSDAVGAWFTIVGPTNRVIYPSGTTETPSNQVYKWNPDHTLAWRVRVSQSAVLQAVTSEGGVIVAQLGAYQCIGGDGTVRWTLESTPAGALLLGADGRFHTVSTTTLTSFETTTLLAEGGWVTPRGDSRGSLSPRRPGSVALNATLQADSLHLELVSAGENPVVLLSSEDLRLWRRWGSGAPATAWDVPRPPSGPDTPGKAVFFRAVQP